MAVFDLTLDKLILKEALEGLPSPSRKRGCVKHFHSQLRVIEPRACVVVGWPTATQRRRLRNGHDEAALTVDIVRLATQDGR